MKNNAVSCLEKTFSFWEDLSLVFEARSLWAKFHNKTLPEGELYFPKNWRMCRQYILESNLDKIADELFPKNKHEEDLSPYNLAGDSLAYFPADLAIWSRSSRRVFEVSSDLELLLKNTSTGDVKWSDIKLPFPSFVIKLEKGFQVSFKELTKKVFKTFLVSEFRAKEKRYIQISCFNDEACEAYEPLSSLKKERILATCRKGNSDHAYNFLKSIGGKEVLLSHVVNLSRDDFNNHRVKEPLSELLNSSDELSLMVTSIVFPLIAGLCLYLKTLTPPQIKKYVLRKEIITNTSNLKCITDGVDICSVQSMFNISDTERVIFRNIADNTKSHEKSPHFRMGSWRRKPGNGDDPNALKCVWVRPTIVRADRLPEGCLPLGAQASICC